MLKEEYIEYVEENIKVAKRKYRKEEEMLPEAKCIFDLLAAFWWLIKSSDETEELIIPASNAFSSLLNRRIARIAEDASEQSSAAIHHGWNEYRKLKHRENMLVYLEKDLITIFRDPNTDFVEYRRRVEDLSSHYRDEVDFGDELFYENKRAKRWKPNEEWVPEFGCWIDDMDNLETLIGPQPDFDKAMYRTERMYDYKNFDSIWDSIISVLHK